MTDPSAVPPLFWLVVAGVAGACVGSFLNVVIWRLPRKESLVVPGSHCPHCQRSLRWFENLPLLAWLLLRARCRGCGGTISARYPLVEGLTALLFVLAAWRYPAWPDAVSVQLLLGALVAVTFIDIDHRLIPDAITKPGILVGLVLAVLTTLHPGAWFEGLKPGLNKLLHAGAGALLGFLVIWGIQVLGRLAFKKEAMGGGDAKLLALVGAFTGPLGVFYALVLACLLGSVVHGMVLLARRGRPKPLDLQVHAGARLLARARRAWTERAPVSGTDAGPGDHLLVLSRPAEGEPAWVAGRVSVVATLPKNRVLLDADVTWQGAAELTLRPDGRACLRLLGLTEEARDWFDYFALSNRYLPFGPYLALGGAVTLLDGGWLRHLLTEAWPAFVQRQLGGP
ncbi:MAG: prepilin peptidase [Planctomycetia bacterium]